MLTPAIASTTSIAATARPGFLIGKDIQDEFKAAVVATAGASEALARRKFDKLIERNGTDAARTGYGEGELERSALAPMLPQPMSANVQADAVALQIWEGTVLKVAEPEGAMQVALRAKIGELVDHVGTIYFEWVMDQDRELVAPGAVFYLTIYKSRLRGGTIVNSQELRFRRLPAWTRQQVAKVDELAAAIASKMKARPLAE